MPQQLVLHLSAVLLSSSYFLSSHEPQARFNRLHDAFENVMTEVHLLFLHSTLPVFTKANNFLQKEEPLIHLLRPHLMSLLKKLLSKFVQPRIIAEVGSNDLISIDFQMKANQVDDDKLVIGFTTRQLLNRLFNEVSLSRSTVEKFYSSAREFFACTTKYLLKWCPFSDNLIKYATWITTFGKQLYFS